MKIVVSFGVEIGLVELFSLLLFHIKLIWQRLKNESCSGDHGGIGVFMVTQTAWFEHCTTRGRGNTARDMYVYQVFLNKFVCVPRCMSWGCLVAILAQGMHDAIITMGRVEWCQVLLKLPIFRCLMVILTMLPRYTQGTICSTMSLCDVMGPIQGVVVTDKEFQSQGMILHSVFCNYYRATSYHECSCLLFMFTRANFWHNRYICDN